MPVTAPRLMFTYVMFTSEGKDFEVRDLEACPDTGDSGIQDLVMNTLYQTYYYVYDTSE